MIGASSEQLGVVTLQVARQHAEAAGLDLVEVAPNANPPVVRIIDWGKYRYEQDKHLQQSRRKQKQVDLKQVRLGLKTDTHDLEVKMKAALKFLNQGHKVRINLRFKGREITHPELGRAVVERFCASLAEESQIEQPITLNGRELSVVLVRKKDAKA
ncbi:translation initiation factor IF-3 [Candidatus Saccharibacteria bacterium]|nr:translation initiation factor IF-3 [Candidatus Saccharibacteria bacterium]